LLKGRDSESRGLSFGTQVDVIHSEKGDAGSRTRFSHLRIDVTSRRYMRPDIKILWDLWTSSLHWRLNVKSSLTIGKPGHPLFPEAVVHASVLHWTWALIPFNVKPALAVVDQRLQRFPKRPSTRQLPIGLWQSCGH